MRRCEQCSVNTSLTPRLDLVNAADTTHPDNCVGCFTNDPCIAQIFWKVCLPCWLIRPLKAFADEGILKMVVPFAATDFLEMNPAAGFAPVPATDRLDNRLSLLHREYAVGEGVSVWCSKNGIDRSRTPSCGANLPQLYVIPEPALLASPDNQARRRMLYHHYSLLRDALMFRLGYGDGDERHALLTTQQWRDIMQGKITKQGKAGSRAQACSASLEDLLRPAFSACGIDDLTGFPVSLDAVPPLDMNRTKELLWELAEINFRYEFLVLDARASGLSRPDECRKCFATPRLLGMDFNESQKGFAAPEKVERLPNLLCMAGFMCDWPVPCERPKQIDNAKGRTQWSDVSIHGLESTVTKYYTESFYELFGCAAVVPMRLDSSRTFSSAV
ncbi:hypothetical protein C8F04DRAFT_1276073 [Mycena alexandri]|uniref:Uncharacterized protein n=1 Tax=Mycena alexandri TaxID=1745969 RepID=A0AAD6S608_9AGAR|nr:hypothetical protein C8F04DRAFT_1276073 [Mycena alexandri]